MGLALLAFVVAVGFLAVVATTRRGRRAPRELPPGPPEQPVAFGPGRTWLAIASDDSPGVVAALALDGARAMGWREGLAGARDADMVFVTPPLDGWTLVVSDALPPLDALDALVLRLATSLATEVQAFQARDDRRGWLAAGAGGVERAYVWDGARGRKLIERGEPTPVEEGIDAPADADVLHVAADWSIDPSSLGTHTAAGLGWLARRPPAAANSTASRGW
jgi:hypothetical protein